MAEEKARVFPPNRTRKQLKRTAPVDQNEQARRQHAAAKRTLAAQGRVTVDPTLINSELTSEGHIGRHPHERVKPRGMSARKTDVKARSGVGPGDVHTRAINPAGNPAGPTDEVVVDPKEAGPMAGGQPVKSHTELAAEAASKGRGGKRSRRRRSRSKAKA